MKRDQPFAICHLPFARKRASRAGQSLIEVMVALFVLTTGFLGVLSLLSQSLMLSKTLGDETTATYLAAEGIELAKNIADHDVYEDLAGVGNGWGSSFFCSGITPHDYEFDYTTTGTCPPRNFSNDDFLEYDATSHTYLYAFDDVNGPGAPTPFTRDIRVIPNAAIPEITVISTVSWSTGPFVNQSVQLEDHFYDWLE